MNFGEHLGKEYLAGNIGAPGLGAYTKGTIHLTKGQVLYLYIGQSGDDVSLPTQLSFNGGGETHANSPFYGKGGGATDIRLISGDWKDDEGLNSRIMVAGGGGSGQGGGSGAGGNAGGLTGFMGVNINETAAIATQTSGHRFGYGRGGYGGESYSGGGGGYYGGGTSGNSSSMTTCGGSSFISGYLGCNAITGQKDREPSNQPNHYSGLVFSNTEMKAGNETMPNPNGGNMTGNLGHGHARIRFIT